MKEAVIQATEVAESHINDLFDQAFEEVKRVKQKEHKCPCKNCVQHIAWQWNSIVKMIDPDYDERMLLVAVRTKDGWDLEMDEGEPEL